MPAATEAFTSAGTIISLDQGAEPGSYDNTGFLALTYVDIGEVTDAGEFGRQYNLVTHLRLGERRTVKRKGSFNDGQMTLQLGRVTSDTGQGDIITALDLDTLSSFRVTLQDGTFLYFTGVVMSYTTNIGGTDQITGSTVVIELTNDIVETAPA